MGCSEDRPPFLAEYPQIDRLIEGGQVLDGLGHKVKAADVVVVGERIVYVGETMSVPPTSILESITVSMLRAGS